MKSTTSHAVDAAMARVGAIDLSGVRHKLIAEEGWNQATAELVERRYRRFLGLHLIDPTCPLVPTWDIDKAWHHHILHTADYARDCEALFGHFLHHSPAAGGDGEAGPVRSGLEATAALYRELFGEGYVETIPAINDARYEKMMRMFGLVR